MTYAEFQKSLAGKKTEPVYLFSGNEDFLIDECVDALIGRIVDPATKSFNLDIVYGTASDAKSVVALASSFPMMAERRVVVVKEFEKLSGNDASKEILSAYIQRPLESTCLILVSLEPDFRRRPFTDLKKHAAVVECKTLFDNQVPTWISNRVRALGKNAGPDACELLQAHTGNSLRAIHNEIDKLLVFIKDRNEITAEDVSEVVGATRGFTVFDLQNAIGRKDMKDATKILERMLELGESPQLIIVMLFRFFNQLWKLTELKARRASDSEIASELRVHPFYLRQYMQFASLVSAEHIEQGFRALLAADAELKSTSRDPHIVLDLLVYSLVRGSAEDIKIPA